MRIGYARVSRDTQDAALQRDALTAAGCERIFSDKITGVEFNRRGLRRALLTLNPGDELVVWKLDRLGRSMRETVNVVLDLVDAGIKFRSLTESFFDTSHAIGRGVLALVASIAEDERDKIRERTRAGIAAARKRGKKIGRPRKLSLQKIAKARAMLAGGKTRTHAARRLNVNVGTLRRALREGKECGPVRRKEPDLADDKSKKDFRARARINMNERYEVDYWKNRFGVSGQALAGAVRATGSTSVKKVEKYLKDKE